MITDSTGAIKAESDYYPWGGELQFVNSDSNHYKFTGKERDSETGLDYFGARYYSSVLGRWVSADWSATPVPVPYADFSDPQSLNLYGYVRGLPTTRADLDGHAPYEWANWLDSKINAATSYIQQKGVASGVPALAATTTFTTGVGGDVAKGFTGLLRLGESVGSLPSNASTTDKIIAVSEEGGRVGGIILAVVGVAGAKGAPKGTPKEGIYEGPDAKAPGKTYVGQSGNIPSRLAQHEASGKFPAGTKVKTTEVQGGKTAREVAEQRRINQLGGTTNRPGSQTSNKVNPIGAARKAAIENEHGKF